MEYIEGLSPAISIEQRGVPKNPRSTTGTVTEINDYLRLLFAGIGIPHCPLCKRQIRKMSAQEIVDQVVEFEGEEILILSPITGKEKGIRAKELEILMGQGFVRVRLDGKLETKL